MKRVFYNYLYNLGYQAITLVLPFLMIPYLTRVLGAKGLGIESYTLSVISIFTALSTGGTSIYATRLVAKLSNTEKDKANKVFYNLIVLRSVIGIAIVIFFFLVLYHLKYSYFLLIQIIYLLASTVFDFTWYFSGKERFKEITVRNLLVKILGFILIVLFVKSSNDLHIYLMLTGLTLLIPNLYFAFLLFRELGKPKLIYFSLDGFIQLLKPLFPFFVMSLVIQLYMNVDKIIIESKHLTFELGIYSQIVKTLMVIIAPVTAIGTVLMPYVSSIISESEKHHVKKVLSLSSNIIVLLGIPIFLGLISISREFTEIYFGNEFLEYVLLFRIGSILILTGCLYNLVIQQVIFPFSLEKVYIQALVIASIVRISFIFLYIDSLKIYAALIAYILGEFSILGFCIFRTRKIVNIISVFFTINNLRILCSGIFMLTILFVCNFGIVINIVVGGLMYFAGLFILKEKLCRNIYLRFKNKIRLKQ